MAVLETILNFLTPPRTPDRDQPVLAAPATTYEIRPLTSAQLDEVLQLNVRCFRDGENYNKHTFAFLLGEPKTLSYRAVTPAGEMVAFAFVMMNRNGSGHLTTIGVAPEHRRRGLARLMLDHIETALRAKKVGTVVLEVRVSNTAAQHLYIETGYSIVQRIGRYYNNGEDCFLMMKPLDANAA